jgi:hypothetical protein
MLKKRLSTSIGNPRFMSSTLRGQYIADCGPTQPRVAGGADAGIHLAKWGADTKETLAEARLPPREGKRVMSIQRRPVHGRRQEVRRELLRQYMRLQRELLDTDPSSSAYQSTMHAFRQMGYVLISSGFEDDLDRLLRIRVLDGGMERRREQGEPPVRPQLHVIEQVPARV